MITIKFKKLQNRWMFDRKTEQVMLTGKTTVYLNTKYPNASKLTFKISKKIPKEGFDFTLRKTAEIDNMQIMRYIINNQTISFCKNYMKKLKLEQAYTLYIQQSEVI